MTNKNVMNMTLGEPLGLLLKFMLPLLLGNLLQQTYNLADAAIVGRILGANAFASVGTSQPIQLILMGFANGLTAGFSIRIAQSFGAGRESVMRGRIYHAVILTSVFAALITVCCCMTASAMLKTMQTPAEILDEAVQYLMVFFLGLPFVFFYNLFAGFLRAVGNSRVPFIILMFSIVVNIALDVWFVAVLGFGCAGAAWATALSEALSAVLCLAYILLRMRMLVPGSGEREFRRGTAEDMLGIALPMGLQFSVTYIGAVVLQYFNNGLGPVCVSAYAAGAKVKYFLIAPNAALATALTTYVGQNYGAGKTDRVNAGIRTAFILLIGYGILASLAMLLFSRNMVGLFLDSTETAVLEAAARHVRCMGCLFWTLAFIECFRNALQALGYTGRAMFSGISEMLMRAGVSAFFVPRVGFTAICWADQTGWFVAGLYCFLTFMLTWRGRTAGKKSAE